MFLIHTRNFHCFWFDRFHKDDDTHFDFLVFTLSFHSSACFLVTLIDFCSPSGEGLKTNKSSTYMYMRQFREWLPSITPGQWSSLKYCGKSFINSENKIGLEPLPCLIPLLQENISVIELSSILTQLSIDKYMDLMTLRNLPLTPYW